MEIGTALFAFLAAVFWFLSAYGKVPPMISYWDQVPENDPYYRAVKYSIRMNKWAATFSGLSALCAAAVTFT
jgi:hypothetical protein